MLEIVSKDLVKQFPGSQVPALDGVSFEVRAGQFLVLLGPSGCGKTTTLRCLAGLETPDRGLIRFGSRAVFDHSAHVNVPVHRRDLGFVFQNYALWPHLSAEGNITFPLRARRLPSAERKQRVLAMAEMMELSDLLHRSPSQLSGGQQQRVALARALVAGSGIVLFDEPLSNLDASLRDRLRAELRLLHRKVGFTGVYVTHDLADAAALADQVAVMRGGRIEQFGTPADVFQRPATPNVAHLVGLRRVCHLTRQGSGWQAEEGDVSGELPPIGNSPDRLEIFSHPGQLQIVASSAPARNTLRIAGAVVLDIRDLGTGDVEITMDQRGRTVVYRQPAAVSLRTIREGSVVAVEVRAADIHAYGPDHRAWVL